VVATSRASGGPHWKWIENGITSLTEEARFWKDRHFSAHQLPLAEMTLGEVRQLLNNSLGSGFAERHIELTEQLHRKSRGVPLYVHMLLRSLVEEGALSRSEAGEWTARAGYRLRWIQQSMDKFIQCQVQEALGSAARPALLAAAVLGDQCLADDWEELKKRGGVQAEVSDDLARTSVSGIIERDDQSERPKLIFRHPLVWEAAYQGMTDEERRQWHGMAADMCWEADNDAGALDHALAASWAPERLSALLAGAIRQVKREKHWAKIAEWMPQLQTLSPTDRLAADMATLEAEIYFGRVSKARDIYRDLVASGTLEPAAEANLCSLAYDCLATTDSRLAVKETERGLDLVNLVPEPQRDILRKRLLLNKIRHLLYVANDASSAIAIIDGEMERNGLGYAGEPRFQYMRAMANHLAGRHQEAVDQFAVLAERFRDDPVLRLDCLSGSARSLFCLARYREAGSICDLGMELSIQLSRLRAQCTMMSIKSNCLHCLGDVKGALALREQVLRISAVTGNDIMRADALDYIAMYRVEMGHCDGVEELFRKSLAIRTRNGNKRFIALSLTHLADFHCKTAKNSTGWEKAASCARRGLRTVKSDGDHHVMVYLLICLSQAVQGLGRRRQAVKYAMEALEAARKSDHISDSAVAARHYGLLIAPGDPRRAEELLLEAARQFQQLGNARDAVACLRELAALSLRRKERARALELYGKAMELCRENRLDRELKDLKKAFPGLERRMPRVSSSPGRTPSRLRIEVMGSFRVFPKGRDRELHDEEWGTVMGRGILACLLTLGYGSQTGVSRQKLFDLFWSGRSAEKSLKVIISRLRRLLGPADIIEFKNGGYRFNWEAIGVTLDREQFEDLWRRGERLEKKGDLSGAWSCYEQAASFYRGRYLEDIEGSWAEGSRQNMDEAQRALLSKLADISKKLGRLETMYFYQDRLGQIGKKG